VYGTFEKFCQEKKEKRLLRDAAKKRGALLGTHACQKFLKSQYTAMR
jgi:hypothetical protein